MELSQHLFARIKEAGVDCTFGIPGDFALPLYGSQDRAGLRTVVCSHEPGAAFAADAYARLKGLGAVMTTYGAGALNMVNPVAMSYAERSPVLVVSGAPEHAFRTPGVLMHHMVKSFESQIRVFDEVCCATALLSPSDESADEIDRVIETVLREKRPGYIEFPRDLVAYDVRPSGNPLQMRYLYDQKHADTIRECVHDIIHMLNKALKPVMYVGVGARRHHIETLLPAIAESWGMPVVSSVLGKSSFPETHQLYSGFYMGDVGSPAARQLINDSDCIISIGVIESDVNTGFGTARNDKETRIRLTHDQTSIRHHHYLETPLRSVVETLHERRPKTETECWRLPVHSPDSSKTTDEQTGPLRTQQIIDVLKELDESKYSFISDIGDAWFIGLEVRANIFMAAGYYASMGFAVPAAVGAGIAAPERRPLVLVGDGAFQMTGNEIGTLLDAQVPATILLLNNSSYMMLETFDGHRPYYDRRPWDYVKFSESQGGKGIKVTTAQSLREAFIESEKYQEPFIIEAIIDSDDRSPAMSRIQAWALENKKKSNS